MPPFRHISAPIVAVLLAGALALPSCGTSPTEPAPRPTVHRTVTAVVRDSLGNPSTYADVYWTSDFDSAGFIRIIPASADENAEDPQVLAEGPWLVTASRTPYTGKVAGASFFVSGPQRAPVDTQVVTLTLHTASRVSGTATLAGRADHSGILVSCSGSYSQVGTTDVAGMWTLDKLPLGRWTVTMYKLGFKLGIAQVQVVTPGSALTVPAVRLISDP